MGAIVHFYCVLGLCFMFQVLCQHLCFSQLCDMFCASVWDFVSVIQVLCYCIRFCVLSSLCYCFIFCSYVLNFVLAFQDLWFSFVPTGHHRSYSCCIVRFVEGRNLHTLETIWHFTGLAMFLLLLPKEVQKWTVTVWNSNLIPSYTCF